MNVFCENTIENGVKANAPFSIVFSKIWYKYFKGIQRYFCEANP